MHNKPIVRDQPRGMIVNYRQPEPTLEDILSDSIIKGRARLVTRPLPIGSVEPAMTIGIVVTVRFNAGSAAPVAVTITSTFNRTSSAAISGTRSYFSSSERHSLT